MEPNENPVVTPSNPPETEKYRSFSCRHLLLLLTIFLLTPTTNSYTTNLPIQYSKHCNHIIQESPLDPINSLSSHNFASLRLTTAFFSGGDPFFHSDQIDWPKSVAFLPHFQRRTVNNTVFSVKARLNFVIPRKYDAGLLHFRRFQRIKVRGPKIPVRRGVASFRLSGFWSEADGKLCMVGSGSSHKNSGKFETFNAVLKLNYSNNLNLSVFDSLVRGVLESVDDGGSESYFKPVSILGVAQFDERHYQYTLIDKEKDIGDEFVGGNDKEDSLSVNDVDQGACSVFGSHNFNFKLEYGSDCDSSNISCNPVKGIVSYEPSSMFFRGIRCAEKRKMQMLLGFWNSKFLGVRFPFDPHTTMIAEGLWDEKMNQLHGVACRILNFTESLTNAYVGDCTVKLSLTFPAMFSLRNRSTIVGQIWSKKSENDPIYFENIRFGSSQEVLIGLPGFRYQYTVVDVGRKSCANKNSAKRKGKTYPNEYSVDMRFDMSVRNSVGETARGFSSPLFVGDQLYEHQLSILLPLSTMQTASVVQPSNQGNVLNISYKMSFTPSFGFKFGSGETSETVEISAEGVYDKDMGVLCMIGCRKLGSSHLKEKMAKNDSLDCEIAVNVQFRAMNAEGSESVKGTIVSTREKSDPLYFGRLEFSSNSIYTSQAKESIWRMDLEITMVLISNTLACVFVALQIFYVKKHPDVLPAMSILMLCVLTLRYMVPLLLNFEALFNANHNQQNVSLGSGGWLEANEIIVRVVTMVAFLLQFRLLQLTWSARQSNRRLKDLWIYEKKVFYVSLPLYIAGGLIAWVVYLLRSSYHRPYIINRHTRYQPWPSYQQHSLWGDLKSYAGLVLDGFLLPQILFNLFFNSTEKTLAASFFIGTPIVRLLPHAYDLYRSHTSTWYLDLSYIYANHKLDFYSTAWDITIPCVGLLFAALVYLQQRFGGRCILPKRFRESSVYEKVPAVSSLELQEEPIQRNLYSS